MFVLVGALLVSEKQLRKGFKSQADISGEVYLSSRGGSLSPPAQDYRRNIALEATRAGLRVSLGRQKGTSTKAEARLTT